MPLISYEGVDVDVPTVDGLRFFFESGKLIVECTNFTGKFALTKPAVAPPQQHTPSSVDLFLTPVAPKFAEGKKRTASVAVDNVTPVTVYEDVKRQKVDQVISPDDKQLQQPNLTKTIQFLESEKENIYGSEDELELLLTQREASVNKPTQPPVVAETKRAPLKQLDPPVDITTTKKPTKVGTAKTAAKKEPKAKKTTAKAAPPPTTKLNFFAPKACDSIISSSTQDDVPSTPDSVIDVSPNSPSVATAPYSPLRAGTWKVLEPKGVAPSQRWGCTATMVSNQRVVVYGGEGDDESTLSDLFVYDVVKAEWSCPLNCESIPRSFHASVYVPGKNLMLVFGGERVMDGSHESLSDLMVLDTECFLWYPPAVSGTPPLARSGHSCTVLGSDVVVFGGSRGRNRPSTVHLLDTNTWNWTNVKVNGKAPTSRTYHSAVAVGPNRVVIFGGNDAKKSYDSVHVLDRTLQDDGSSSWSWFNPCVVGTGPTARTGQVTITMDHRTIVVYGGWDPQHADKVQLFGDVFALDTGMYP
ncbi:hypothetical protein, variant [Aphanomyces astaci]|uniref:Uncharacterized protein n=1 Tax=Aphanomyces astaci TaxID=112090 RepID=W4G0E9_APHAT|nr:hypothetical protein, variant [Aphanomyces astaci]ETV72761.1 hypothetical protein, variant [Aphanomyces astaci]|eukprot:XP_009837547.1 hypothetical protein, variant [Aphanomyces astaci]